MMVAVKAAGAGQVHRQLKAHGASVNVLVREVVHRHGKLLSTMVKANASTGHHKPGEPHIPGTGPGPNVATGDYRRSINVQFQNSRNHHVATVGTNAPQGRRLELGFTGVDSLGRVYDQPPYPHFGPALDKIEPLFLAALQKAVDFDRPR